MDWDRAYDNRGAVPDTQNHLDRWAKSAWRYRRDGNVAARYDQVYGDHPRQRYDIFVAPPPALGSVIFVHGGYWRALDKAMFSHLALPFIARGLDVIMINYPLVPDVPVADITASVSLALNTLLPKLSDPVYLVGHSVGGHLVMRQICDDIFTTLLAGQKIIKVTSISGLHDLSPLLNLSLNDEFALTTHSARAESPCHYHPAPNIALNTLVGSNELPAFIEQAELLADRWPNCTSRIIEKRDHFTILDEMMDPNSQIIAGMLG